MRGAERLLVVRRLVAVLIALLASAAGSVCAASGAPTPAISAALYSLKAYPLASFVWFPASPHTGESISLVSTSSDRTSPITEYAWDVADNGPFGPFKAGSPATTATFPTPASHQVRLRVTSADHLSSTAVETIHMSAPPPGVLAPFPVVRIVGKVFHNGVRIRQLRVAAPAHSQITVTCQGPSCPARSARRVGVSRRGRALWTRFRQFEHFVSAGAVVQIRVSNAGDIGAYTRFVVRRRMLPVRLDSCLDPAGIKPIACPSS
jgi:hypothetical protein